MLEKLETPVALVKNCEIESPEAFAVNPNHPPEPSIVHSVKEGENLISIANRPDYAAALKKFIPSVPPELLDGFDEPLVNARALIYFNFGTVTPEYVNWYLLNITGCYHATENRQNRRFSNHDATSRSPKYGLVPKRAGKIYIPTEAPKPKPKPTPTSTVKGVKMWARLNYEDGLFSALDDIAKSVGGGSKAGELLDIIDEEIGKSGREWTTDQLRKVARLRRFAKPLRSILRAFGKASPWLDAAEFLLNCRLITGYLAMSYDEPADTHYAWEVDLVLKGGGFLNDDSGSFTTSSDYYRFRSDLFNPEDWGEKHVQCTMTGGSFSFAIKNAFKRPPHSGTLGNRIFTEPSLVYGRPGALDWQLSLRPLHPIGGGVALYQTPDLSICPSVIRNGKRRSFTTIISV
ncbi:hypothetical protein F183_A38580 [Bryobacterales bacterium F-183]|nr:hypothetical protein F183_A38580 [Bryobacterales bacterium F-183]